MKTIGSTIFLSLSLLIFACAGEEVTPTTSLEKASITDSSDAEKAVEEIKKETTVSTVKVKKSNLPISLFTAKKGNW